MNYLNYFLHLLILFDIYLIVALSLNVIVGYVGLLTLAHAAYFGIGAYTYAVTALLLDWGFIPAALLAVAISVVFSLMLSIASWRFRGDFFVLISLAVQVMIFTILKNWYDPMQPVGTWSNMTNGDHIVRRFEGEIDEDDVFLLNDPSHLGYLLDIANPL